MGQPDFNRQAKKIPQQLKATEEFLSGKKKPSTLTYRGFLGIKAWQ